MSQLFAQNIVERLAHFGLIFFCVMFVMGLALRNFGSHYFHKSLIFVKQLGALPYLQYPLSVPDSQMFEAGLNLILLNMHQPYCDTKSLKINCRINIY
jgi:hypothetical protein